ncbi:MAG: DUF2333 domain-containing protein [Gammaproteobacteria bacterium]|nr:MAG: DUF2333 domain-containing protein [Gammaproteobacteria bacterium]
MVIQDWKNRITGAARSRQSTGYRPAEERKSAGVGKSVVRLVLILALPCVILGWYWSREPAVEDLDQATYSAAGTATVTTLIHVVDVLLDKPGGYLSNDIMPPGLLLDNIPSWEYGVVIQIRDLTKALREAFARSQSQSTEDEDLARAEPKFNYSHESWILPATEKEYRAGRDHLHNYLQRLVDTDEYNAQFYARADNLRYWLNTVEARLGSLSQRLGASVGQRRLNTDLAGDSAAEQATPAPAEIYLKTPWLELDDIFYEARGTTWALIHFLKAVEIDFAEVLEKKNARISMRQIIRGLEATQSPLWSPIILNGSGFGVLANHSLTMVSYISSANAAIIDLRELLEQG